MIREYAPKCGGRNPAATACCGGECARGPRHRGDHDCGHSAWPALADSRPLSATLTGQNASGQERDTPEPERGSDSGMSRPSSEPTGTLAEWAIDMTDDEHEAFLAAVEDGSECGCPEKAQLTAERDEARAERDRARDLAAGLEAQLAQIQDLLERRGPYGLSTGRIMRLWMLP